MFSVDIEFDCLVGRRPREYMTSRVESAEACVSARRVCACAGAVCAGAGVRAGAGQGGALHSLHALHALALAAAVDDPLLAR